MILSASAGLSEPWGVGASEDEVSIPHGPPQMMDRERWPSG
jgi:hypothetical protein